MSTRSAQQGWVVVIAALVASAAWIGGSGEASADFTLLRQCDSPTATSWWSSALYEDDANPLFQQESFPDVGVWPEESTLSPGIRDCFGTGTPHSRRVLLHWVLARPEATVVQPHPILLVPGAGDNGKRVFTFLAYALAFEGYNVFALTFAHPNGDNYQHAEQIANALKLISDLYDGTQVDVVAHSMGGIASWIYAANNGDVEWGLRSDTRGARYGNDGTRYRGDIRRLVLMGTPLGGVDTVFRWPNVNFTVILDSAVNAPISWDTYYPLTTGNIFVTEDLMPWGFFAPQDYFPGQAQTLLRWDDAVDLPGTIPALGLMSYQQDWYTTYEGGLGFYSNSEGIDAAIARGGHVMEKLAGAGVDPDIEVFLAAGFNPILPLEYGAVFIDEDSREQYGTLMEDDYPRLKRDWLDPEMPYNAAWGDDVQAVFAGRSIFGELSAPSDGVVFVESATRTDAVTLRGAEVKDIHRFEALNHLELAYAGRLAAYFFGDEEVSGELYDPVAAEKYDQPENQVVEWIDSVLHTDVDPGPDAGDDTGGDDVGDGDPDAGADSADDGGSDIGADEVGSPDGGPDDNSGPGDGGFVEPDVPEADTGGDAPGQPALGGRDRSGCATAPQAPSPTGWLALLAIALGALGVRRR